MRAVSARHRRSARATLRSALRSTGHHSWRRSARHATGHGRSTRSALWSTRRSVGHHAWRRSARHAAGAALRSTLRSARRAIGHHAGRRSAVGAHGRGRRRSAAARVGSRSFRGLFATANEGEASEARDTKEESTRHREGTLSCRQATRTGRTNNDRAEERPNYAKTKNASRACAAVLTFFFAPFAVRRAGM